MNVIAARRLPDEAARTAELVPWMQQLATRGDTEAAFPESELAALRQAGILAIPLPNEAPYQADGTRRCFGANPGAARSRKSFRRPAGRSAYQRTASDCPLWHAGSAGTGDGGRAGRRALRTMGDGPARQGLRMMRRGDRLLLEGGKMFCSGAGFATRALLTARDEAGDSLMLVVTLNAASECARSRRHCKECEGP